MAPLTLSERGFIHPRINNAVGDSLGLAWPNISARREQKVSSRSVTKGAKAERKFSKVVEALSCDRDVIHGAGKGFGSGTLKVNGKIFAMLAFGNQLVVKLPKDRVDAHVSSGSGKQFEPRPGRLMKEWLVVESENANWIGLAKEACDFVKHGTP